MLAALALLGGAPAAAERLVSANRIGRITFANHVAAWRRHGMKLGAMDDQVMAPGGFGSTGDAKLRVWRQ